MANIAISFGVILLVLGIAGYIGSGMASPTALIPAVFGLLLLVLGAVARDPAKRKMAMHIAAVVGVLGFFGSARGLVGLGSILAGDTVARPNAVIAQSIMAILMLIFIVLCFRSFRNARRDRVV
jgi:O-antigen/teichoic acid export membrane protein